MEQFGRYQLTRRIGSGGMAEVFLARTLVAQGLSKQLVIKKIHPAFARSRQFAAMFVDEARVSLGLNHPNVVQVFDFGQIGESWYLAMEYVEGLDLLRLIQEAGRKGRRVPHGLAAYVVQQIAKGLDYAHRKADDADQPLGIVHRDVSPQNVLISLDGAVKLTDFGIARARDVHEEEGVVKGKFAYMAPEQARGEVVDRRADVFSAGVVLFELATGRALFPGKGKEVLDQVRQGLLPRPRKVDPEMPPALEDIILRALTFQPAERYQTGRDLQNALGRFQFDESRAGGAPIDSGALAQFVAQLTTPAAGPTRPRPPSAPAEPETDRVATRPARSPQPGAEPAEARERKQVFVVEGHVRGATSLERRLGSRDATRVLDEFRTIVRELAYKHDAYVHRAEDAALTLVVGLPVAGEDDASRALRLALALIEALDGISLDLDPELRLAVGLQRGVALVRRRRGARFGYELSAATTGIARRLATEAASGDILCGGAVYRVAQAEWNFEDLATIDLIGAEATVATGGELGGDTEAGGSTVRARVYRLRGAKGRSQRVKDRAAAGSLISREHELAALREAYRNTVTARAHRHVLIVGDEGVGKKSLVNSFLEGVPPLEAVVLRGAARVATMNQPLGVFADLVRELFALPETAEPHDIARRIDKVLVLLGPAQAEEHGAMIRRAAATVMGVRLDGVEPLGDDRRALLRQGSTLIERHFAAGSPLVLVVEDLHWADDQSLELFEDLLAVPATRGLLGVMTSRHDPRILEIAARAGAQVIRLDELDQAGRVQFLASRFAGDEHIRELSRHILARTGGNPFFINEMLESLLDRGILSADADGPQVGKLRWIKRDAPLVAPTTVEALLGARIDRLPAAEKDLLVHAAVLGRRFPLDLLTRLMGRPLEAAADGLVQRRLLERDDAWLAFRNELTMTVAYGTLPEEERRELHRAAADQLLADPRPAMRDDAQIARHLDLAGDPIGAAERYLRAASHAADVGSSADAFRHLSRVLRLLPAGDHERRFTARCLREVILRRLARRPAQLREIDGIRKEAEALGDPARLAMAHARLAQFYVDVRKLPSALKAVAPALQYARDAGDRLREADALRLRAEIARLSGQGALALSLTEQGLALCGEGDREVQLERATLLNARGMTLWTMGRLREAVDVYLETLVIYRALGLPRLEARSLNNLGVVFSTLGDPEQALAHYKSSFKLDQDLGDRASMALKLGNIGQCYADLGDLDRGERYLGKAIALAEEQGERAVLADLSISLGQVLSERGRLADAVERFERGLDLATANGDRFQEVRGMTYLALAELDAGAPADVAHDRARAAAELAHAAAMPVGEIFALAAQGLALGRLGRAAEGAELSGRAVELQARTEHPEGAEQILAIHARLCEAAGRPDAARAALERAAAEVERKAARLSDELRATYLAARTPRAIAAALARPS